MPNNKLPNHIWNVVVDTISQKSQIVSFAKELDIAKYNKEYWLTNREHQVILEVVSVG